MGGLHVGRGGEAEYPGDVFPYQFEQFAVPLRLGERRQSRGQAVRGTGRAVAVGRLQRLTGFRDPVEQGLRRAAVKAGAYRSQSIPATVRVASPSATACRRTVTADSGASEWIPPLRCLASMAALSAIPLSAHGPQATEVAARPFARRCSASASSTALAAA